MNDINNVTLVGRLTRDAELKYTTGGTAISKPSIAVNRSVKKGDEWTSEASFIELEIWGKTAESLCQYLAKGQQVAVTGELKQDRWQDKDGGNRSKVVVTVRSIQLLGGKKDDVTTADIPKASPSIHQAEFEDDSIPF
jgi:single-strand DNA-binding protein